MFKSSLRLSIFFLLSFLSLSCHADTAVNNIYQDGITLTIINKSFDKKAHKIQYCSNKPCIIDGKIFYGGNGLMPKTEVASLVFSQKGKKVYLDVSSIYDTGVTNSNIKKYISVESWLGANSYRIVGYFGASEDKGAGEDEPYIAHWLVMPNGSVRNHLGDYESLVSLVFKINKDFNISQ